MVWSGFRSVRSLLGVLEEGVQAEEPQWGSTNVSLCAALTSQPVVFASGQV